MRGGLLLAAMCLAGCLPSGDPDTTLEEAPSGYVFDDGPAPEPLADPEDAETVDAALDESDETVAIDLEGLAPLDAADAEDESVETAEAEKDAEVEPEEQRRVDANAERRRSCERRGGRFARTGAGLFFCVVETRDANKRCDSSQDCQGECFARSRTCAPITPLLGCNEVLTAQGVPSTICVQ